MTDDCRRRRPDRDVAALKPHLLIRHFEFCEWSAFQPRYTRARLASSGYTPKTLPDCDRIARREECKHPGRVNQSVNMKFPRQECVIQSDRQGSLWLRARRGDTFSSPPPRSHLLSAHPDPPPAPLPARSCTRHSLLLSSPVLYTFHFHPPSFPPLCYRQL